MAERTRPQSKWLWLMKAASNARKIKYRDKPSMIATAELSRLVTLMESIASSPECNGPNDFGRIFVQIEAERIRKNYAKKGIVL